MTCVEQFLGTKKSKTRKYRENYARFCGGAPHSKFYFVVNILKIAILNGPHSKCSILGSKCKKFADFS